MRNPYQQQIAQQELQGLQPVNLPNPAGYGGGFGGWLTSPDISQGLIGAGQAILNSNTYGGNPAAGFGGFNEGMIGSQQRRIDNAAKAANTQAAFARALRGGNGSVPAALQLKQAYQEALDAGDHQGASNILLFSKVLEKNQALDEQGNVGLMPGAANAVGTIAAAKQSAKNASDLSYAAPIAQAKERGSASGAAEGAIEKKVVNAPALQDAINRARTILPKASSGGLQNLAVGTANILGVPTQAQDADSALNTLGGVLTSNVPRMEGPQSDADRLLYQQMAGDVANAKLPYESRLKALDTVEALNQKYFDLNKQRSLQKTSGIGQIGGMPKAQKAKPQSQPARAIPMQSAAGHKFTVIRD